MSLARQLTLIEDHVALAELAHDAGADYGEVFTRRWVVDLILDLVGYLPERDLGAQVLIEPSCGTGAFLVPAIERLITSGVDRGRDLRRLGSAVRAFDLLEANAEPAPDVYHESETCPTGQQIPAANRVPGEGAGNRPCKQCAT